MHRDSTHKDFWLRRVLRFYVEGFRGMGSVGRKLWVLILVKLAIFFLIFKLFLLPNVLERDFDNDDARGDAVRQSLIDR